MIVLDSQLFSLVEDSGFTRLLKEIKPHYTVSCQKYITEMVLSRVMKGTMDEVKKELQSAEWYFIQQTSGAQR